MTRIKSSTAVLTSKSTFENTVDEIAKLQLKIDADTAVYNEEKSDADTKFKTQLKRDRERLAQKLAAAEMFAAHHREELLGARQSSQTRFSLFGFRKSPGVLKTLNSKWTFKKALDALKDAGKEACVKVTESLDKQAVKKEIPESELAAYGLRMEHPEEFWIEPIRAEEAAKKRIS
jgi:hypothetical protein